MQCFCILSNNQFMYSKILIRFQRKQILNTLQYNLQIFNPCLINPYLPIWCSWASFCPLCSGESVSQFFRSASCSWICFMYCKASSRRKMASLINRLTKRRKRGAFSASMFDSAVLAISMNLSKIKLLKIQCNLKHTNYR